MGPGCKPIAVELLKHFEEVTIIVNDYDSFIQSKIQLKNEKKTKCKMMDYSHTDFDKNYFDLIYAQASTSVPERKDILKEIKRILNEEGVLCPGEIVSLREPVPAFVNDVWKRSGLDPLHLTEMKKCFESNGFVIINEKNLSSSLEEFYERIRFIISKASKKEIEENKKFFSGIKHESNVYLKLGGDKYIGFKSLIMSKAN
ncbi:MAG: methyltransferase domain-containing protein [Ignavibacteriaceae bacterium]